jgi:hypothetical protein
MGTALKRAKIRDMGLMGGILSNDIVRFAHNRAADYFL